MFWRGCNQQKNKNEKEIRIKHQSTGYFVPQKYRWCPMNLDFLNLHRTIHGCLLDTMLGISLARPTSGSQRQLGRLPLPTWHSHYLLHLIGYSWRRQFRMPKTGCYTTVALKGSLTQKQTPRSRMTEKSSHVHIWNWNYNFLACVLNLLYVWRRCWDRHLSQEAACLLKGLQGLF